MNSHPGNDGFPNTDSDTIDRDSGFSIGDGDTQAGKDCFINECRDTINEYGDTLKRDSDTMVKDSSKISKYCDTVNKDSGFYRSGGLFDLNPQGRRSIIVVRKAA